MDVTEATLRVEVQSSTLKTPLAEVSLSDGQATLKAGDSLRSTIRFEIKEQGQREHIHRRSGLRCAHTDRADALVCTVTYAITATTATTDGLPPAPMQRSFRKLYKFEVRASYFHTG